MPTETVQVTLGNRDGREYAPTGTPSRDYTGTYLPCNRQTSASVADYAVFEIIVQLPANLQPGASIASTYLKGRCTTYNDLHATIYGDAVINPNTLQASPAIYSRSRTSTSVVWAATLTLSAYNTSPDVSSIVQELVDDPSFQAGDEIGFIFIADTGASARCYFSSYESSSNAPFQLEITYTNNTPNVEATPASGSSVDFGSLSIGATKDETIQIENIGTADLTLSSPSITGTASADFTILSPSFPVTITPSNSTTLTIRATSSLESVRSASLSITTNDPNESTLSYTLSYAGIVDPAVSTVPGDGATIDFGTVDTNSSKAHGITVYEVGADDLILEGVSITGTHNADFAVSNAFPLTIPNGSGPVTVLVQFTPQGTGTRTATLTITTNAPDNPTLIYALTGIGVAFVSLEPERGITHRVAHLITVRDNTTGQIAAEVPSQELEALRYERKLNDVGVFQLTIHTGHRYADAFSVKDALVDITRIVFARGELTTTSEGTYLVRMIRWFQDENEQEWLVVSGYSLEYILLQRIIDPRNDPLAAGGFTTKSGAADAVMTELVNQQAGANASPEQIVTYLTEATPAGSGEIVGGRWAWEGLLDTLTILADSGGVDFHVTRTSGIAIEFRAEVIGANLTRDANYPDNPFVYFAPEFGNIRNPDLTIDYREEKTLIYLLGQGAGEHVDIYQRQSPTIADTRFSYAAVVADARQVEDGDATQYLTQAVDALLKHRAKIDFTFEVVNTGSQYRVLWDLGDWVTAAWHGRAFDMRIVAVKVDVTSDGERITPVMNTRE